MTPAQVAELIAAVYDTDAEHQQVFVEHNGDRLEVRDVVVDGDGDLVVIAETRT